MERRLVAKSHYGALEMQVPGSQCSSVSLVAEFAFWAGGQPVVGCRCQMMMFPFRAVQIRL